MNTSIIANKLFNYDGCDFINENIYQFYEPIMKVPLYSSLFGTVSFPIGYKFNYCYIDVENLTVEFFNEENETDVGYKYELNISIGNHIKDE